MRKKELLRKIVSYFTAFAMVLSFFAFAPVFESPVYANIYSPGVVDVPTPVDGRILPPSLTGDSSNWVEIAQNGKYSLIVRQNFINIYPNYAMYGKVVAGDLDWQITNGFAKSQYASNMGVIYREVDYLYDVDYNLSGVREFINDWFNGTARNEAEKLPANARLRAFTMQASPFPLGTSTTHLALMDGFSKPTKYQVGVGQDVAFALSYGESANFLSETHYLRNNFVMIGNQKIYVAEPDSSPIAKANYAKVNLPKRAIYGMWLRSPGDTAGSVAFLQGRYTYNPGTKNEYTTAGRVFQGPSSTINSSMKGLCYPALWVDQDIFNANIVKSPPPSIEMNPVAVDGRILTPDMTGDTSNWVEIAQAHNGDYSLIVRQNFINIYPEAAMYGKDVRGDLDWQNTNGFVIHPHNYNDYMYSGPRKHVNYWFNSTNHRWFSPSPNNPPQSDKLPLNARLRDYTVQANVKQFIGTSTTHQALVDGFSKPTHYQTGMGNDVAFLLSYGESANFLSESMYLRNNFVMVGGQKIYVAEPDSSPIARANYAKMKMPTRAIYGMWLRSPGDVKDSTAYLQGRYTYNHGTKNEYTTQGRVFQAGVDGPGNNMKGLVYPAVWVGKGIFGPEEPPIGPPTKVEALGGDKKITLLWDKPDVINGHTIAAYQISVDNGAWVNYPLESITYNNQVNKWFVVFLNLDNNTEYTYQIRAVTTAGLIGPPYEIKAKPDPIGDVGGKDADLLFMHGVITTPVGGWNPLEGLNLNDPRFSRIVLPREVSMFTIHRNFIEVSQDATFAMYTDFTYTTEINEVNRLDASMNWLPQVRVYLKVTSGNGQNIRYYEILVRSL